MELITRLAFKSISFRFCRSLGLVLISLIMSFAIVFIAFCAVSMKHGTDNVKTRMGADIIVVPDGHGDDLEGILLTAGKSYFYMDDSIVVKISNMEGVEKVSSQTFLMTLEASCCDSRVRIIGIDTKTDFTVTPWLEDAHIRSLREGEIIVGSNVGVKDDKVFKMFDESYKVAGILDQSGSAMDDSVFIDISYMETLMNSARKAGQGEV